MSAAGAPRWAELVRGGPRDGEYFVLKSPTAIVRLYRCPEPGTPMRSPASPLVMVEHSYEWVGEDDEGILRYQYAGWRAIEK
jgi:hypothetical protein